MTEEKKSPRKKPAVTPQVDKVALAMLFTAFLRKGYTQVMAVQSAKHAYQELFNEPG